MSSAPPPGACEPANGEARPRSPAWFRRLIDTEEAWVQLRFAVPMVLTNMSYYSIPLVSVMFSGHLGNVKLAGATLGKSWATVTGYAFVQKEIAFDDGHNTSEPQQLNKQGHDDINIYKESRHKEKETREGEDVQSKGHVEISVVDFYETSCEIIQSESTENGNYNRIDNLVDELDDLWKDTSVALACSKTNGRDRTIVLYIEEE